MTERGELRVYLGAAPGVGKTYAMLDEGHRRALRGTDVVIAFVETHGRPHTAGKLEGLEVLPRREVSYRGSEFTEMDLPAVLARAPGVALVDELAHTNVPGVEHEKRWQDVEALLEAGIDVISTVNIQHLESLNDVVEAITGVPQRETVPDSVVRAAEQVELVDMTPEALRRRMAHGNIYTPEKVDAALSNYFRPGNLTALRELALLWLADSVESGMQRYREQHGISSTWETRERVVVALTGGPEGEVLIRRAARIAARATGGDLLAVHIVRSDGLAGSSVAELDKQRLLVESLGGSYHSVIGDDVADAVLEFARANNATQIVIGASRRKPIASVFSGPGSGMMITRKSGSIDVHVIGHDYIGMGRVLPPLTGGLTLKRRIAGLVIAAVLLAILVPVCAFARTDLSLATEMLLFLLAVIVVSLVGGIYPAVATAVVASLLLNYFFVPPIHRFTISARDNVIALIVFVVTATLVSRVVDLAARRTVEAARSNAEAETLSTLAGSLLRGERGLPALLGRVQETFGMSSVTLLRRDTDAPASVGAAANNGAAIRRTTPGAGGLRGTWSCVDSIGDDPCMRPEQGDTEVPVGEELALVLRGRTLAAEDQRVLAAFATQLAIAYEQRRLVLAAEAAAPLAEADRMRTALLNAVSHDLRTPIASAKAAVSTLRNPEIDWSEHDRQELLEGADHALDRLTALVTNLLDLSRLQAGVLSVIAGPVGLDDVVSRALEHAHGGERVELDLPLTLPAVMADPGLLERVVANLVENALRYSPVGKLVRLAASTHGDVVELRVIDRGPGIPPSARDAVFAAFQRRDDRAASNGPGVGLGLAIVRGFVEAMHGEVTLDETPGGGLSAVVSLPVAKAG
ncbi:MAG TPA: sensor histidine kinase KdpD [Jatrophihabitantaceae bacterium]|jgi:two-component system sensor histidine kinase KdpD|nr:sensor histidine kinase KdpD [Jatrophihabitantaceae bacterium]